MGLGTQFQAILLAWHAGGTGFLSTDLQEQSNRMSSTGWEPRAPPHLFHVKGDDEFQGGDGGEERGEEGSNPADGLPIHNTQDVVWDGKFLLSPALDQL